MSNWIKVKLGDIVELKRESYQPQPDEVLPYIGLEHIGQGTLRLISVGKSNEVTSTKSYFSKGDILFGKLRPYFRKVVRPKFNGVCSTDILVLTSKNPRKFNQTFLFYLMASQEMIDLATASSSGTKMPRVDWKVLQNLEISILEDVNEQERIGKILETIDDKIDINIRMNKTLEEMAMTLYKHWFVDFGPFQDGEFVESELGMIPKGWKAKKLGDLYDTSSGGTPSRRKTEYYQDGTINWLKTKELNDNFIFETEEKITELGLENSSAKVFPKNTVIIAMYGATVGKLGILSEPSSTNQACCAVIEKNQSFSYVLAYLYLLFNRTKIVGLANGGAQQNINQQIIRDLPIVVPTEKALNIIQPKLLELFELIRTNEQENRYLINLRDYLLPRLLSGEIDVSKAEKQVEEVL